MIFFFQSTPDKIYGLESQFSLSPEDILKLEWLFGNAKRLVQETVEGEFVGPRKEMVTPWSTNAVEITLNMGIKGISRIEEFFLKKDNLQTDPMLQAVYKGLDQKIFHIGLQPAPVKSVPDIEAYSRQEGLALNDEEIEYLNNISKE